MPNANENLTTAQQVIGVLSGCGILAFAGDWLRKRLSRPDQQFARMESELARKCAELEAEKQDGRLSKQVEAQLRDALYELQKNHIPQKTENSLLRTNRKNAAKLIERAIKVMPENERALALSNQALDLLRENIVVSRGD